MHEWTPIEINTPHKVELAKISSETGRSIHECFGLMVHFWCWATREQKAGRVNIRVQFLPSIIGGDIPFWSSVASAGWIEPDETGFRIPRSEHWLTREAKLRLLKHFEGGGRGGMPLFSVPAPPHQGAASVSAVSVPPDGDGEYGGGGQKKEPPLRVQKQSTERNGNAFHGLTVSDLADTNALSDWLIRQDTESDNPVIRHPKKQDFENILAAAEHAMNVAENPLAYFVKVVGNGKFTQLPKSCFALAKQRISEFQKKDTPSEQSA